MSSNLRFNSTSLLDGTLTSQATKVLPVDFTAAAPSDPPNLMANHSRVLEAALAILAQGEALLETMAPAEYQTRVPAVFNGTIGGHYRHCLDHFTNLLRSVGADNVDYDHRDRDPRIESQPAFALHVTQDLRARFNLLSAETLRRQVITRCEVSYGHGDSPATRSSFARELAYCIAHAIHHFALISVIARLMDLQLPTNFGVAPSTLSHQAASAQ